MNEPTTPDSQLLKPFPDKLTDLLNHNLLTDHIRRALLISLRVFDIIFDQQMPFMKGTEFLIRLKEFYPTRFVYYQSRNVR